MSAGERLPRPSSGTAWVNSMVRSGFIARARMRVSLIGRMSSMLRTGYIVAHPKQSPLVISSRALAVACLGRAVICGPMWCLLDKKDRR